jgi:hypothetical protein
MKTIKELDKDVKKLKNSLYGSTIQISPEDTRNIEAYINTHVPGTDIFGTNINMEEGVSKTIKNDVIARDNVVDGNAQGYAKAVDDKLTPVATRVAELDGTNITIEGGSSESIKNYIDNEDLEGYDKFSDVLMMSEIDVDTAESDIALARDIYISAKDTEDKIPELPYLLTLSEDQFRMIYKLNSPIFDLVSGESNSYITLLGQTIADTEDDRKEVALTIEFRYKVEPSESLRIRCLFAEEGQPQQYWEVGTIPYGASQEFLPIYNIDSPNVPSFTVEFIEYDMQFQLDPTDKDEEFYIMLKLLDNIYLSTM